MASRNAVEAIGADAESLIREAAERHVARLAPSAEQLTDEEREGAIRATEWALDYWLDIILGFINTQGSGDSYGTQHLCFWGSSMRTWINDEALADELWRTMLHFDQPQFPRLEVLEASRDRAKPLTPPYEYPWWIHARSFRDSLEHHQPLEADLRERFAAATGL